MPARHWWLTSVILATQEAEISRISVCRQHRKIVCKTLSQNNPAQKGLVEWFKVKALSSSPSTAKKRKEKKLNFIYVCVCMYISIHEYIGTYAYVCVYTYICVLIYTYMCI
jgi:hypothetical protein